MLMLIWVFTEAFFFRIHTNLIIVIVKISVGKSLDVSISWKG